MQNYPCEAIRNIGIVGHNGVGKTTLVESMLFKSGAIKRPGRVEDGNTVSDFQPEEVTRKITISATLVPVEWNGKKLNILDTPGYSDFLGEIEGTMRAVDGALFVICAASGVQVQTEVIWEKVEAAGLPRMVFINKMNRENADFFKTFDQLKAFFPGGRFVACQLPIGQAEQYKGYFDLLTGEAVMDDGSAGALTPELEDLRTRYLDQLTEIAVEGDDDLLTKYLDGETITSEEVIKGLAAGFKAGIAIPVVLGTGATGSGVARLMDLLGSFFPEPGCSAEAGEELKAYVFKTVVDPYVGKINYL
ncbi:MAG TPA: GTP-binding protein, partial [Bacillota bacterium]|nr:GTP-binding protein [Bacillota bacterium]